MADDNLSAAELQQLIQKVFQPGDHDRALALLVDVPNPRVMDEALWQDRRALAKEWQQSLDSIKANLTLADVGFFYYENAGSNNADLPGRAYSWSGDPRQAHLTVLEDEADAVVFQDIWSQFDILLVLSKFSATAPLKLLAKEYGFRAASMPGFTSAMLPALSIDYEEVHRGVMKIKERLDRAVAIDMRFAAVGEQYAFHVDLRQRTGHASSGLLRERGIAGNLPSGEAYIVPYEGEMEEPSETRGQLPVQFDDEIVVYSVKGNRAIEVLTAGKMSEIERSRLADEPAYGNIAEIGFGVLQPFGVKPVGETLLDEKLGLHVAFGRSEHFGGVTSPESFNRPEHVVHIDRIYIPEVQPRINVVEVTFLYDDGAVEVIMADGSYCMS